MNAFPESSNIVNVFSKFHICDVRCVPNVEFAKCQVFFHLSISRLCSKDSSRTPSNFSLSIARYQASQRPVPSFFAESQISPNAEFASVKFRRMPNFAACRVFKVPIFLNAEYATCRVFPSAQFFRLLRAEFAKSRVLSNARFCV